MVQIITTGQDIGLTIAYIDITETIELQQTKLLLMKLIKHFCKVIDYKR